MEPKFRVALALRADGLIAPRPLFIGAHRFAHTRTDWQVIRRNNTTMLDWEQALKARPDGILGLLLHQNKYRHIARKNPGKTRVVILNDSNANHPFCRVMPDNAEIGRRAADHFIERRLKEFAFVGLRGYTFSKRRQTGFFERLRQVGFTKPIPVTHAFDPAHQPESLSRWINRLPAPCGIFCATDIVASTVIEACQNIGIAIPGDIAVLGTSNDEMVCSEAPVTISSIKQDFENVGYRAAAVLDNLLRGLPAPGDPVLVPPGEVVIRESTRMFGVNDPLVQRALVIIHGDLSHPLNVKGLLKQLGNVSQRLLEIRFRDAIGRSPYKEILNARVMRAQKLLRATRDPLEQIALQSGFGEAAQFSRHFHKICKMTPSQYRRAQEQLR